MEDTSITKWCPRCGEDRPIAEFYVNKHRSDGLSSLCAMHQLRATKEYNRKARQEFIEAMGGICENPDCAGFPDWRVLQVDHINGDGSIERAAGEGRGTKFYAKVLANRAEYMLLCANCNQLKKFEQDETVGKRIYPRQTPTEKLKGIGKGHSKTGQAALLAENARRAAATHCKNGHKFTPENTIERPEGGRKCRTCANDATKRYQERKRKK